MVARKLACETASTPSLKNLDLTSVAAFCSEESSLLSFTLRDRLARRVVIVVVVVTFFGSRVVPIDPKKMSVDQTLTLSQSGSITNALASWLLWMY